MMDANRTMLQRVVAEMGELREQVVLVGGAVAGLLITNDLGDPVRETDDVDCMVEIGSSKLAFYEIEKRLRELDWLPGSQTVPTDPLCRFRKGTLVLDVVPTQGDVLGFSSFWAGEAVQKCVLSTVGHWKVQIVSAPYFLALKLEAFLDRGKNDYYGSHDLEDIIAVVEGREEIVDDVARVTTPALRRYLAAQLEKMWPRLLSETIPGAVRGNSDRLFIVEARLREICQLGT